MSPSRPIGAGRSSSGSVEGAPPLLLGPEPGPHRPRNHVRVAEPPQPAVEIDQFGCLTLNLTADARYKLSDTWALEASFGTPMITREARPDGLTRALVANMGLRVGF